MNKINRVNIRLISQNSIIFIMFFAHLYAFFIAKSQNIIQF